jgi:hypothetical protein
MAEADLCELEHADALTASLISYGSRCSEGLDLGMNSSALAGVKSFACRAGAAEDAASRAGSTYQQAQGAP